MLCGDMSELGLITCYKKLESKRKIPMVIKCRKKIIHFLFLTIFYIDVHHRIISESLFTEFCIAFEENASIQENVRWKVRGCPGYQTHSI